MIQPTRSPACARIARTSLPADCRDQPGPAPAASLRNDDLKEAYLFQTHRSRLCASSLKQAEARISKQPLLSDSPKRVDKVRTTRGTWRICGTIKRRTRAGCARSPPLSCELRKKVSQTSVANTVLPRSPHALSGDGSSIGFTTSHSTKAHRHAIRIDCMSLAARSRLRSASERQRFRTNRLGRREKG
jgi:hypothetical protein